MGIEAQRQMAFHCPLGEDVLMVRNLTGSERLGTCFVYTVTLYSEDQDVDMSSLLGKEVSVEVRFGLSKPRFFSGIVAEISHHGNAGRYVVYRAVLRPWLWLLSQNRNCRIFQHETALDIVRTVFKEHDPQWFQEKVFGTPAQREYCVQYRESDYDFVSRLLEDEGIYYYFQHEQGKHTLVLADSISSHDTAGGFETLNYYCEVDGATEPVGVMFDWCATQRVVCNQVTLRDFDFKKSRADLSGDGRNPDASNDYEVYDYPGNYEEPKQGETRARVRIEEHGAARDVVHGETNSLGLCAGNLFKLQEHPRKDQNKEYLIVGVQYHIDSGSFESGSQTERFKASIAAIDSQTQFRPVRTTPEPIVAGAQTAVVVGPSGQEIWTDRFGRVKVQFHWDRLGKRNESSSCWIRVAQVWAGSGWGSMHVPRIGQEVVVEFLEGNIDRPLIVGRVYNDANKPPYDLPDNATQSGIKSRSSMKGGQDDFNEFRFEDKKGEEEIVLHAQKDFSTTVEHDLTSSVEHDAKYTVKNDLTVKVAEGTYATTVDKGQMVIEVPKDEYKLSAKQIEVLGEDSIQLSVMQCEIVINKMMIKLTAFGSSITLDATGIKVVGVPTVSMNM